MPGFSGLHLHSQMRTLAASTAIPVPAATPAKAAWLLALDVQTGTRRTTIALRPSCLDYSEGGRGRRSLAYSEGALTVFASDTQPRQLHYSWRS